MPGCFGLNASFLRVCGLIALHSVTAKCHYPAAHSRIHVIYAVPWTLRVSLNTNTYSSSFILRINATTWTFGASARRDADSTCSPCMRENGFNAL
jgi:hypothetical protein